MMTLALRTEVRRMVRRLHRVEVRRGRDDLEDDDDDRSCDGELNRMTQRWRFCERVVDLVSSSSPSSEVELLPLLYYHGVVWVRAPLAGPRPDRSRCTALRGAITSLNLMSKRLLLVTKYSA